MKTVSSGYSTSLNTVIGTMVQSGGLIESGVWFIETNNSKESTRYRSSQVSSSIELVNTRALKSNTDGILL